jgi:hypothetical protein
MEISVNDLGIVIWNLSDGLIVRGPSACAARPPTGVSNLATRPRRAPVLSDLPAAGGVTRLRRGGG